MWHTHSWAWAVRWWLRCEDFTGTEITTHVNCCLSDDHAAEAMCTLIWQLFSCHYLWHFGRRSFSSLMIFWNRSSHKIKNRNLRRRKLCSLQKRKPLPIVILKTVCVDLCVQRTTQTMRAFLSWLFEKTRICKSYEQDLHCNFGESTMHGNKINWVCFRQWHLLLLSSSVRRLNWSSFSMLLRCFWEL